jgi:hypothetical protein
MALDDLECAIEPSLREGSAPPVPYILKLIDSPPLFH